MSVQQEKFTEIANAIREKTGTTEPIKPSDFASKISDVYEAGKAAGGGGDSYYDDFWDSFQTNGTRTNYKTAFGSEWWTNNNFKPKYDMQPTDANTMFNGCSITGDLVETLNALNVTLDFSKATDMGQVFGSTKLSRIGIVDFSSATKTSNTFSYTTSLQTIDKVVTGGKSLSNSFIYVYNIKNIAFDGELVSSTQFTHSSKLTHDSLMNILNALKDYSQDTSGTTYTLTIGAKNIAKLTSDEIKIAKDKGWVIA